MITKKDPTTSKAHVLFRDVSIFLCLVLALASLVVGNTYINKPKTAKEEKPHALGATHTVELPQVDHKGIWLWKSPTDLSDEDMRNIFGVLAEDKINTVYIDISGYIDSYENPDPAIKQAKTQELQSNMRVFVRSASSYGISVQALAGQTTWGFSSHAYIPSVFVDFVHTYNLAVSDNEKLSGLQFDIESYNNAAFKPDEKSGLIQYLGMVDATVQKYKDTQSTYMLGFAVPYWFDNENGNIPEITSKKKTAPVAYHLLDTLNSINAGYIVIMDYRNTTDGKDGSIAHAQNEVVYASKYAPNTKIIIGQETTDVQPAKITFYGKDGPSLIGALDRISNSFDSYTAYHGVAIHDYYGYAAIRKKLPEQ
ncbi:MAG TPA: hypothetical protein VK694_04400 [Verrucomicrobiae bacterium]|nr:hypothetical protein [Verrucomicrobiae bacterium]